MNIDTLIKNKLQEAAMQPGCTDWTPMVEAFKKDLLALAQDGCNECGGTGSIVTNPMLPRGISSYEQECCPKCNGTGKVPVEMKLIDNPHTDSAKKLLEKYSVDTVEILRSGFKEGAEAQLAADKDVMAIRELKYQVKLKELKK